MAGPWLVDGTRIASKIRSAYTPDDHPKERWTSNPTRVCPSCQHVIDNDDVNQEWPGLPGGVKFDPTDQQIILHLLAKVGIQDFKPHPFINEFIPTVENDDGICYTLPQKLPGVRQDGSASHFFHRAVKAYTTGTRKRRKIQDDGFGDVRWHKTGRTKPVMLNGVQRGCKKIMVLYMSMARGGKAEKTSWVMHQYHLGTEEDEREGEYVISKIFYQQQQGKPNDQTEQEVPENVGCTIAKVDPVTPEPPRIERRCLDFTPGLEDHITFMDPSPQHPEMGIIEDEVRHECKKLDIDNHQEEDERSCQLECQKPSIDDQPEADERSRQLLDNVENHAEEDPKWWDSESQNLLDSQQLVEGLSLCDEFLQSQSPDRDGSGGSNEKPKGKPGLSDYARLGPEDLKKDLEECQNLVLDPADIELDTPPEFRLSQLEFGSQESFLAWGGSKF